MKRYWFGVRPVGCLLAACASMTSVSGDNAAFERSGLETGQEPAIDLVRDAGGLTAVYQGILESAPKAEGPWSTVPGASSPWVLPATGTAVFYRVQTDVGDSLFSGSAVVHLSLTGPFQAHFDLAFAGLPDGIFPPRREKPYFDGALSLGSLTLPASIRVRGNSSLQECPFPKLKFKISREDRMGTPFADAREVRIGTHCAEGGRGTVGRLREEIATYREALAYEVLTGLGFTAPRVRRARIEYHDTSDAGSGESSGWQIRRSALLLEDVEVLAERLGGRALSDEEVDSLENADFSEELVTGIRLFEALIGNWDYAISTNGVEMWNVDVIELPGGTLVPVATDFDLASWVTGEVLDTAPHDYRPDLEDVEREAHFRVEQILKSVSTDSFAGGRARFLEHRAWLEDWVAAARVDDAGRVKALRHVAAFFAALEALDSPGPEKPRGMSQ